MNDPGPRTPTTLGDVQARLRRMREDGQLDDAGESALHRHFSERSEALQHDMATLVEQFRQRSARDGDAAATQWLVDAVEALGRRDGEESRRVFSTVLPED